MFRIRGVGFGLDKRDFEEFVKPLGAQSSHVELWRNISEILRFAQNDDRFSLATMERGIKGVRL